jgi:hypothetical protein
VDADDRADHSDDEDDPLYCGEDLFVLLSLAQK